MDRYCLHVRGGNPLGSGWLLCITKNICSLLFCYICSLYLLFAVLFSKPLIHVTTSSIRLSYVLLLWIEALTRSITEVILRRVLFQNRIERNATEYSVITSVILRVCAMIYTLPFCTDFLMRVKLQGLPQILPTVLVYVLLHPYPMTWSPLVSSAS